MYLYIEEFGHFLLFLLLKDTQIHPLLHWCIEKLLIHVRASFHLVAWISDHEIVLLSIFVFVLRFDLWMQLLTLLYMAINVTMVAVVVGIFSLVCCGSYPFFISPFPCLLPLLGIFLVLLLLWPTWFPFLLTYIL